MSMEIGLYQGPTISQQLNLAPQLLQWLRLLQAPTTELSAMIQHEMETNPTLEAEDPILENESPKDDDGFADDAQSAAEAAEEAATENPLDEKLQFLSEIDSDWRSDYSQTGAARKSSNSEDQEKYQFIMDNIVASESLHDHLANQLTACNISKEEIRLAELVIGSLDGRGYLGVPLAELADLANVDVEQMEKALKQVQTLDPAGIGARDLRECLLLQLQPNRAEHQLAIRMLEECPELLSGVQFHEIARALNITEAEIASAVQVLAGLQAEPGRAFTAEQPQYVSPDVLLEKIDGEYVIELNDEQIPHLRISSSCRQLLKQKGLSSEDLSYLRRKMRSATFLIQGIGQRQETLKKVAREIVRVQRDFFDRAEGELVPLTMAGVAKIIGVHETTVSRALANKYIRTPRGLYELKYFFRSGYACADGSALTPDSVKEMIAGYVDHEDPSTPLTDLQMVQMLRLKGLQVARRTIAKYREELGIDSSKQRIQPGARKKSLRLTAALPVPGALPAAVSEPVACVG